MSTLSAAILGSLLAVTALTRACGSGPGTRTAAITLRPCDAVNVCTRPGTECRPVDGVNLCVYVCPTQGGMAGATCGASEFTLDGNDPAACRCVEQQPAGRVCRSDADCGYGPDVKAPGPAHLCAIQGGASTCLPVGVACRSDADCGGRHCDPSAQLCTSCTPTPEICGNGRDDDCVGGDLACPPVCTGPQACESGGCAGARPCLDGRALGECAAPRRCPEGWTWDGQACAWVSPFEPRFVKYYPHSAHEHRLAATGTIGHPAPGGVPAPVYAEIILEQWSTPPAAGGGNHCGKGDSVTAWVGCVHSNGERGWGRDVRDHEWQSNVMIPVKCDPGDTIGVWKYTWGHDASWHCTRQLSVRVIRNHDPVATCAW